jgi:Lipopolysaccharide kinase (Kdo/WaaP) family
MRLGYGSSTGGFCIRARSLARRVDCDRHLPRDLIETLLRGNLDELLAESAPLQLKDRCATARLDHPAGPLLLKRHEWGDWLRTSRMLLRAPTGRVSARLGLRLAELGISTPRPRASVECGIGPFGYRSYLLTDYIEGTTLYRFVRSGAGAPAVLAEMARQVAANWQRLIDLRISHNDLKPENFIVDPRSKVWVIDFERPRCHHNEAELRRRHLADLSRFLHVRTWRSDPAAAELFRVELLKTTLGKWLSDSPISSCPGLRNNYSPQQLACRLSVVIMSREADALRPLPITDQRVESTIDSARDIADEILVVSPNSPSAWHVVRRIDNPGTNFVSNPSARSCDNAFANTGRPKYPWVLVLNAGDAITPELARQLPEQIVDRTDCDAYRIPVEERYGGRPTHVATAPTQSPIRLFQQNRCSFTIRRGEIIVEAESARVGQLVDKLHHDRRIAAAGIASSAPRSHPVGQPAPLSRRAA